MESYAVKILTLVFIYLVVVDNAESASMRSYKPMDDSGYEFVDDYPPPKDYPNYDNDQYMKMLRNITFPKRDPSEILVEKENCDSNDRNRFCCSVTQNIRPYAIKKGGKEMWVYQAKLYEQYLPQTRCKSEGSACFGDYKEKIEAADFKPKCKTDQGSIHLLVHDRDTTDFRWITVAIDVSCSCHLTTIKR